MSDKNGKTGDSSVTLKTGFTRGGKTFVAGDVVKIGPGLAQRLVDRGQAAFTSAEAKRVKAKRAAAQKVADEIAKGKQPPAPPEKASGPKPTEQGNKSEPAQTPPETGQQSETVIDPAAGSETST